MNMNISQLKELVEYRNSLEAQIKELKHNLDNCNDTIGFIIQPEVSTLREIQNKDTGVVNLSINGTFKIKHSVPKKVKWDQGALSSLATMIQESGRAVNEFMTVKYDVPEKTWAKFDDETKAVFAQARTIEHGKPSIEIEVIA